MSTMNASYDYSKKHKCRNFFLFGYSGLMGFKFTAKYWLPKVGFVVNPV